MGHKISSVSVPMEHIITVRNSTKLKVSEIKYLYKRFQEIKSDDSRNYIIKPDLLNIPYFSFNPISCLLIKALFEDNEILRFDEFAIFIDKFRAPNRILSRSKREHLREWKIRLIFNLYDIDNDGIISRDDLYQVIFLMFNDHMKRRKILQIVNVMMLEVNEIENNNQITFEEFYKSVEKLRIEDHLILKIPQVF